MKADSVALRATLHCLTGCAIGEVLGLVLSIVLALENLPAILLATILAFVFGYSFTLVPLVSAGSSLGAAARIALAGDTVSIVVMELVDNAVVLLIPGAMNAGLADALFWGSLSLGLVLAFSVAYPVNAWMIRRGRGHAVGHAHH